jgi:hypothetical protein
MSDATDDLEALLGAFHVDRAALDENRAGRLAESQARRLLRSGTWNLVGAGSIGVGLGAILLFVARKPLQPVQLVIAGALFVIVTVIGARYYRNTRAAVAEGAVERLSGPVTVRSQGKAGFYLAVAGKSFRLPIRPWHVRGGATYNVYVAPRARVIVAMEMTDVGSRKTEVG